VVLTQGHDDFSVYTSNGSVFNIPLFKDNKRRLDYIDNYVCFDIDVLPDNVSVVDC